jgi:hypothetical protein
MAWPHSKINRLPPRLFNLTDGQPAGKIKTPAGKIPAGVETNPV